MFLVHGNRLSALVVERSRVEPELEGSERLFVEVAMQSRRNGRPTVAKPFMQRGRMLNLLYSSTHAKQSCATILGLCGMVRFGFRSTMGGLWSLHIAGTLENLMSREAYWLAFLFLDTLSPGVWSCSSPFIGETQLYMPHKLLVQCHPPLKWSFILDFQLKCCFSGRAL